MRAADAFLAVEIGKGARDAKCPVIAACAQAERVGGLVQQSTAGLIGSGDVFEQAAVAIGIVRARVTCSGPALRGSAPRACEPTPNAAGACSRRSPARMLKARP